MRLVSPALSGTDDHALLAEYFDPACRADPYPVLARIREASPLVLHGGDLVVVARYDHCRQMLRDPSTSNDPRNTRIGADIPPRQESLLFLDPPVHTRVRRLVSKAFTPRVVAALEPRIVELVGALFDRIGDAEEFDVVRDFAVPLPMQIICELLGIPLEEYRDFENVAHLFGRVLDFHHIMPNPEIGEAEAARGTLIAYLRELIQRHRSRPDGSLLSHLVAVEEQGDTLSEVELLATCALLMGAGFDTTVNLVSSTLGSLISDPAAYRRLRDRPDLVPSAVEEGLRHESPVQFALRSVMQPTTLGGLDVTPGTAVLVLFAAANRDPEHFPEPDRFVVDRAPSDHVALSAGIHYCLGAALGRVEAAVAVREFVRRVQDPVLVPGATAFRENVNLRGRDTMPVRHRGILPA
ncbi:cytochrome P450 [Pseudonocardia sp. ICBG601]|uniref:cytochrome P450 n=1 Tax=Pseudonocardia sp. ICBG601 TaxID=2846759 RepID=UPI001CF6745F|nr:cytochrome P450 [Pseudonocardia sp. ICBG601]